MKKKLIMVCLLFIALISGCAKKDAAANLEDKPTIKLAVCSGAGLLHEDKIWEINEGDYPYSVEIVDYLEAADGDISLAVKNLNKELAAGDGPDMIDLSSFPLDVDLYASKGVFEDLYPYLDRDEGLSRSDFIQSILSSCEYDGKLVSIMSGFNIKTMYVTTDILEGQSTWSVADFYPYIGRIGEAYLESNDCIDTQTLLSQMCATSFNSFVDYKNKRVSVDRPIFIDLLEHCTSQEASKNNGIIVGRLASVSDFMEHQFRENAMGGEIKYIGFPTLDGSSSGNYINNQTDYFALCSNSDKKDACWKFIREFLTDQFQTETYVCPVARAFPTNVHTLDQMVQYSMESIYDENNSEITIRSMYPYACQPAGKEEINQILELINSLENSQRTDIVLQNIIEEELAAFVSGNQDATTTAGMIQNRVGIYVNEIG